MRFLSQSTKFVVILILLMLFIINPEIFSQSKSWYVDKNASGNNSGINWSNAWTSFSNIGWNSINAGDTLVISGGVNETTYYETLTIGRGNITIKRSAEQNHNGKVIIDGQGVRSNGISNQVEANPRTNVVIDGLDKDKFIIKGYNYRGIEIRHTPNQTIKNLTIYIDQPNAFSGIFLYGNEYQLPPTFLTNILIENVNVLQDPGSYSGSGDSDGMQIGGADGVTIRNCFIKLQNSNSTPHSDCVQFYHSKNITIENNEFHNIGSASTDNKQVLYLTNVGGDIIFRNNYFHHGQNSYGSAMAIEIYDNNWWTNYLDPGTFEITNNTVVCDYGSANAIRLVQSLSSTNFSANTILKNNILVNGNFAIDRKFFTSPSNCDYNIFYDPNGTTIFDQPTNSTGTTTSWSTWQGYGYDIHSYITNPLLTGYIPNTSGDADDNGTDLSILGYSKDIEGTPRPQGSAWDIGAFEVVQSGADITPPQLIGAELLDSVNLMIEFSELMDESTVENINNYTISNGIDVMSATMQGNKVLLLTSVHITGIYQITVSDVTDISGNLISSSHNSVIYEYSNPSNDNVELPVVSANASHWYLDYTPNKTIDGAIGNDSRWGGSVPMPDTIVFSLSNVQILNETKISFYEWDNGRIYNYSIQVSTDLLSWNEIKTDISSHSEEWSIEEINPIEAKFIKIILLSNNQSVWAGIWEAKFLGQLINSTDITDENAIPIGFMLEQNYPNPFNPTTKIKIHLPYATTIKLTVYNILGEVISELVNSELTTGIHVFDFDALELASGIYLYRVESPVFIETKKMILIK